MDRAAGLRHEPNGVEPLGKRERAVLEQRALAREELAAAAGAGVARFVGVSVVPPEAAAAGALSVGVPCGEEVLQAGVVVMPPILSVNMS